MAVRLTQDYRQERMVNTTLARLHRGRAESGDASLGGARVGKQAHRYPGRSGTDVLHRFARRGAHRSCLSRPLHPGQRCAGARGARALCRDDAALPRGSAGGHHQQGLEGCRHTIRARPQPSVLAGWRALPRGRETRRGLPRLAAKAIARRDCSPWRRLHRKPAAIYRAAVCRA